MLYVMCVLYVFLKGGNPLFVCWWLEFSGALASWAGNVTEDLICVGVNFTEFGLGLQM